MEKQNNHIDRRGFLKIVGISAATTTAALYGCGSGTKSSQGRNASSPVPTDQMTYRSVGGIKDKVSLLGYGCMRWPTVPSPEGKGDLINQEAVNELVDYAIAHGVNYIDNGMLDFLLKEREAGRIRHLGWSFHGDVEVFDQVLAMHDTAKWDFVQIQLNYVDWRHATGNNVNAEYLYGELAKRNIAAVIMEPLLGGRLSNVPEHIVGRLKQRRPEDSVASWAFRFAGSPELVLTVLSGMTYMEHLQDNIRTYSPLVPLTDDDKEYLEETAQLMMQYPTIPCNDCKYCMPCPYGIDIPAILVHYNKCVNEGNIPQSQSSENYKEARRAFLVGYDRSVPKLRQASHCIGCNQCTPHCPQSIHIPEELHRIDRFVEQLKQGTL